MSSMTILAARRVLPPDLMTPAKASKPRMKLTGPEAVPPPLQQLLATLRIGREVRARARAVLEQHALGLGEAEDRLHRVVDAVDEAGRALRLRLAADVEPDGRVEGHLLLDEQVLSSALKTCGRLLVGEVAALAVAVLPQAVMVSATREISWRTERSRSGVPDACRGSTSAPRRSSRSGSSSWGPRRRAARTRVLPFSPVMAAVRSSHWTFVKPSSPGLVK